MPKVTLISVKGNSYICSGFLSIGVYVHGTSAILIDSGGDESCAKDVSNGLEQAGYVVTAIINTHCHPDHCGGNAYFQKKYPDIRIYATHDEQRFIEDTDLAPRCFCGQAQPFSGLLNKYIAPQKSSTVTNVIAPYQDQIIMVGDVSFKVITLPGHTPGSIGIITPDNVLYTGDAIFGEQTFAKHYMLFYTHIGNTLASLKKLTELKIDAFALYHGGVVENLESLAQQHIGRVLETKNTIVAFLQKQSLSIDQLTQKIMQFHNIPNNMVSFVLTQTTVRAYLAQLELEKAIVLGVQDGMLLASIS